MRSTNLIPVDFGIAIARKWNGKRSEVKEYVKACSFVVLTSSFIFLLVQRKSEKLCVIVDRKKKAKISWVCSHCWLRQRCELSSTFSFFLANRGIVHNIEIYDLLLGWYSYGSSKLFLFHTSRLFFLLLQFVFLYPSRIFLCIFHIVLRVSFKYFAHFFYPNINYLVAIRLANLFPER